MRFPLSIYAVQMAKARQTRGARVTPRVAGARRRGDRRSTS